LTKYTDKELLRKSVEHCQRQVSLLQHHDAVTGTARRAVVLDYRDKLISCIEMANKAIESSGSSFSVDTTPSSLYSVAILPLKNTIALKKDTTVITLINPTSNVRKDSIVQVSSNSKAITIKDKEGIPLKIQISPNIAISGNELQIDKANPWIIIFKANVPSLGYSSYYVVHEESVGNTEFSKVTYWDSNPGTSFVGYFKATEMNLEYIEDSNMNIGRLNEVFKLANHVVEVETFKGLLSAVKSDGKTFEVKQGLRVFDESYDGGVYIFSQSKNHGTDVKVTSMVKIEGIYQSEIHSMIDNSQLSYQMYRIRTGKAIDMFYRVDMRQLHQHDLVLEFLFDSFQYSEAYIDANGWIPLKRQSANTQKLESQFYPLSSKLMIQNDVGSQLTLMTRSSLAVGLYEKQKISLTLDRQTRSDDGRGLGEPVDDSDVFIREFRMLFEDAATSKRYMEDYMSDFETPNTMMLSNEFLETNSLLTRELPTGIKVHSFRPCLYDSQDICIQIEHFHSHDEKVTINLLDYFKINGECYESRLDGIETFGSCNVDMMPLEIKTFRLSKYKEGKLNEPKAETKEQIGEDFTKKETAEKVAEIVAEKVEDKEDQIGETVASKGVEENQTQFVLKNLLILFFLLFLFKGRVRNAVVRFLTNKRH
jgi:alpha-mannosidase II